MENSGVEVHLFDRGTPGQGEQGVPDQFLQLRMLEDAVDHNGDPGVVVLLTGDGAGCVTGRGFHSTLERTHNRGMRGWAEDHGEFIALDDYCDAITFREPSRPGHEFAPSRNPAVLDLSHRAKARCARTRRSQARTSKPAAAMPCPWSRHDLEAPGRQRGQECHNSRNIFPGAVRCGRHGRTGVHSTIRDNAAGHGRISPQWRPAGRT